MSPPAGAVAAVVLAAGAGTRFAAVDGTHKLLADWRGRPVVWWALRAAHEAAIGPVWVVTGAAAIDDAALPPGTRRIADPRWSEGQATSLAAAVDAAVCEGCERVVVGLGDQPLVLPSAWRAVAAAPGRIAVATYAGRRGNPVGLGRDVWDLLPRTGDAGARGSYPELP